MSNNKDTEENKMPHTGRIIGTTGAPNRPAMNTLVIASTDLYDIFFIISEASAIGVDQQGHKTLADEANALSKPVEDLIQAKEALKDDPLQTADQYTVQQQKVIEAQRRVRQILAIFTGVGGPDEPPLKEDDQSLIEVYSFAKQQLLLVSVKTLEITLNKQKVKTRYPLDIKQEETASENQTASTNSEASNAHQQEASANQTSDSQTPHSDSTSGKQDNNTANDTEKNAESDGKEKAEKEDEKEKTNEEDALIDISDALKPFRAETDRARVNPNPTSYVGTRNKLTAQEKANTIEVSQGGGNLQQSLPSLPSSQQFPGGQSQPTSSPSQGEAMPSPNEPQKQPANSIEELEGEVGTLDENKFKRAWDSTKKKLAADWELGKIKYEGQVPSKLIAWKVLPPWIVMAFNSEQYDALDCFIATINNAAKKSWGQHAANRKALVELIEEEEEISPDEWAKIKREVKDIWWRGWHKLPNADIRQAIPKDSYQTFAKDIELMVRPPSSTGSMLGFSQSEKDQFAERLANEPLPPVKWDASVGAQMLRYSAGADLKLNFNLLKTGKLALKANAEAEFKLLEGEAECNYYLPSSEGKALTFELPVRFREGCWNVLTDASGQPKNFIAPGPHFEFNKSIVSPKGMFELSTNLGTWDLAGGAVQKNRLSKQDAPLLVQVVGHADPKGPGKYNQHLSEHRAKAAFGLLKQDPNIWLSMFKNKIWREYEAMIMAVTFLCQYEWKLQVMDLSGVQSLGDYADLLRHNNLLEESKLVASEYTPEIIARFQRCLLDRRDLRFPSGWLVLIANKADGNIDPSTQNGMLTLECLVAYYFRITQQTVEAAGEDITFFDKVEFITNESIGLGETQPILKNAESIAANEVNRRIELIPYALTDEPPATVKKAQYNFGDIRIRGTGSLSGTTGADANFGAEVYVNVDKRLLLTGATLAAAADGDVSLKGSASTEKEAEKITLYDNKPEDDSQSDEKEKSNSAGGAISGGIFFGAKAEGGLKAAIDWRPPKQEAKAEKYKYPPVPPSNLHNLPTNNEFESANYQNFLRENSTQRSLVPDRGNNMVEPDAPKYSNTIRDFVTLGDVGYTVTGMAGVGLEGEFSIGFDTTSKRFQIKVKAEAALGVGFGGSFSFSVGIEHMFDFAQMVHEKLRSQDFHFIDIFEAGDSEDDINTYELFSAWSYEMFEQGHILKGGLLYQAGNALDGARKILENYDNVIIDWKKAQNESENLNTLIRTIYAKPEQLAYCTPETKGRLLFRLLQAKIDRTMTGNVLNDFGRVRNRLTNELGYFVSEQVLKDEHFFIEEAALTVIEQGIISHRDWQKTLQNVLPIDKNGVMQALPEGDNDTLDNKVSRAVENGTKIRNILLADKADNARLQKHLDSLINTAYE